ncbi:hypothetical protein GPECTOR_19g236 [Gonium pectorale]|uniref:Phospholipid scramblase n=1 Tax=Gonium pectorale TaxID=33097 RepID=A0A150GJA4_GONPE|nr:hypothetical protein GPECTOR_19g236 [Gonium pectorale]|eukprot:KXZ49785.1 hypothetical protein GPECTOR_19g236 [Gonium pectorale]
MPADKATATDNGQPNTWLPSGDEINALKPLIYVQEESSCCLRAVLALFGGLNLRALTLRYWGVNGEQLSVDRPCRCGACWGPCCKLHMTVKRGGQMIGAVEEDCDSCGTCCFEQCCLCTCTHKVLVGSSRETLVHKYSLRNPMCCCGRVNNCCGATYVGGPGRDCCKPNYFIDILEPGASPDHPTAVIQKTYGAGGCSDCCRCMFDFNNYIMPFPPKSLPTERALLITALLSIEYAYFSRQGGEST